MSRTIALLSAFLSAAVALKNDTTHATLSIIEPGFSGIVSFSHLPYTKCLETSEAAFDIAILGMPFDTTTTYRPGARFGPQGVRMGSRRQQAHYSGFTTFLGFDPYKQGKTVIDCGDVPISPFDNLVAYGDLLGRKILDPKPETRKHQMSKLTKSGTEIPRIITIGGDHTLVLPIVRALGPHYGPISIIHLDSHPDTGPMRPNDPIHHGSYFTAAYAEGLLTNSSAHVGIRQK
ncbi:hypothetical protein BKA62DRAFT_733286, partial [Auriculariales sp. MPI-PUGE-AT-0066]